MSRRVFVRLSLSLMLLVAAITLTPSAEAGCEYGHTITTTYYAYTYDDVNYWCESIIISPSPHTMVIGGTTYSECDNSFDSWGDTTSCPNNYDQTMERCGLVCN